MDLGRQRRDGSAVAGQRGLTLAVGPPRRATCPIVSTTPSTRKYPRPMTGYTTVLTQSTGTTSAQPNACRILSTTSGYLRAPVPEVHRSRTAKSSTSNTTLVAWLLTAVVAGCAGGAASPS